jgi:hypothetical protein
MATFKSAAIRLLIDLKKKRKPNMKDLLKKAINLIRSEKKGRKSKSPPPSYPIFL